MTFQFQTLPIVLRLYAMTFNSYSVSVQILMYSRMYSYMCTDQENIKTCYPAQGE